VNGSTWVRQFVYATFEMVAFVVAWQTGELLRIVGAVDLDECEAKAQKLQMCLAEAGYPSAKIKVEPVGHRFLFFYESQSSDAPIEVVWRARELVQVDGPVCLLHFKALWIPIDGVRAWECEATSYLTEDCGS
jgi:hypothetical protein